MLEYFFYKSIEIIFNIVTNSIKEDKLINKQDDFTTNLLLKITETTARVKGASLAPG